MYVCVVFSSEHDQECSIARNFAMVQEEQGTKVTKMQGNVLNTSLCVSIHHSQLILLGLSLANPECCKPSKYKLYPKNGDTQYSGIREPSQNHTTVKSKQSKMCSFCLSSRNATICLDVESL